MDAFHAHHAQRDLIGERFRQRCHGAGGVLRRYPAEDHRYSLWRLVAQIIHQCGDRNVAKFVPHSATVRPFDVAHDLGDLFGRHDAQQDPFSSFSRAEYIAGAADLFAEFADCLVDQLHRHASQSRHRVADAPNRVFVELREHAPRAFFVQREHDDRRLLERPMTPRTIIAAHHCTRYGRAHATKLRTSEPATISQPLTRTKKISLNGRLTTTGGSIIMPMPIKIEDTTMSITRKGRNNRKPIWNAFESSLTRNAEHSTRSGTWLRTPVGTGVAWPLIRLGTERTEPCAGAGAGACGTGSPPSAAASGFQPARFMN